MRPVRGFLTGRRQRRRLAMVAVGTLGSARWPDLPPHHWASAGVIALSTAGLVRGFPDGRFHGAASLTRYELAALLDRSGSCRPAGSLPGGSGGHPSWRDLPQAHWARQAVVRLVDELGVLRPWPGVALGYFSGDQPATRYELAVALAGVLPDEGPSTPDDSAPDWAATAVARVRAAGVLVGFPDGRFHGERPVSRYEATMALYKALQLPPAPEPSPTPPTPVAVPVVSGGEAPVVVSVSPLPDPASPPRVNWPRVSFSFLPEYVSELATASRGEAAGWALASGATEAEWADGPLVLAGSGSIAEYGLHEPTGTLLARQETQLGLAVGYRWYWGREARRGEVQLLGLGQYLGRHAAGASPGDLIAMDLQGFGLGLGVQWRWPVASHLVATARGDYLPVIGAQFGDGTISGQLGLVQARLGLEWYAERLCLGLGYRLRYLYDGQQTYSQWGNGLVLTVGMAL